jgi:hypothetical protein
LAERGIPKATSHTTMIRGWCDWTDGVEVRCSRGAVYLYANTHCQYGNDPRAKAAAWEIVIAEEAAKLGLCCDPEYPQSGRWIVDLARRGEKASEG